jgi:hypothetical protein
MTLTGDIQIRDPFILPRPSQGMYYLFGTTDLDPWKEGTGSDCRVTDGPSLHRTADGYAMGTVRSTQQGGPR